MKAYSLDLRERIVAALEEGASVVSVAQRFGVGERTVRTYRARARAGALAPLPIPGRPPRLPPEQEEAFVVLVREKSDWTLEQLGQEWQGRTGVFLPRSTWHDHLKRLGGRYKKESHGQRTQPRRTRAIPCRDSACAHREVSLSG